MSELFSQLAFVSAVLAGFAFTFVGGLLSSSARSRAFAWTFGSALLAAVALMVAAVGSVFTALALRGELMEPARLASMHQLVSQSFLLGILCLVVAAGCVGWLRGRRLGWLSFAIAGAGFVALGIVLLPFLRLQ